MLVQCVYTEPRPDMNIKVAAFTVTEKSIKLRSEIVWHRFFAAPAFIRRFRYYITVRKLYLKTSYYFSCRFRGSAL